MTIDDLKKLTPVELDFICAHIYKLVKDKVTEDTKNEENFNHDPDCCPRVDLIPSLNMALTKESKNITAKTAISFFLRQQERFIIVPKITTYFGKNLLSVK